MVVGVGYESVSVRVTGWRGRDGTGEAGGGRGKKCREVNIGVGGGGGRKFRHW